MNDQQFQRKLNGLIAQCDRGLLGFSRVSNGVLNGFLSMEAAASAYGDDSVELGTVSYYAGVLQSTSDAEESLDRLERALSIHDRVPFLTLEQEWIARIEVGANQFRLDRDQAGLDEFSQLTQHLETTSMDTELRVQCLQRIGYYMHTFGHYEAALAHNEAGWRFGSSVMGEDHPTVNVFKLNMGENSYELGRPADAEQILQEVKRSAERTSDYASWCEICFKLGVLAHESRRDSEAERWMREAVEVAEKSERKELVEIARARLDELHKRVAGD